MKKVFLIFEFLVITCFVLFVYGMFKDTPKLTFGYGIGDIFFLILYMILFITQITISLYNLNRSNQYFKLITLGAIILLLLILNLTIWRGGEYPLSKGFFYTM
jgi:hypothetical protein